MWKSHGKTKQISHGGVSIVNEFEQWMELNTDLSTKSIKNYLRAIKTIDIACSNNSIIIF